MIENEHWLRQALKMGNLSKDLSSKVGVVFEDDQRMIAYGYNGMLRGMNDSNPSRNERPEKYYWYEHAETNGMYNVVKSRHGSEDKIALLNYIPEMDDMRALLSVGVNRVYMEGNKEGGDRRIKAIAQELNVDLIWLDKGFTPLSRQDEKAMGHLEAVRDYGKGLSHKQEGHACFIYESNWTPVTQGVAGGVRPLSSEVRDYITPAREGVLHLASKELKGKSAYVSHCPCEKCAVALGLVQVKEVYAPDPKSWNRDYDQRWIEGMESTVRRLMDEFGVPLKTMEMPSKVNKLKIK